MCDKSLEFKVINLLKDKSSVILQEDSTPFLLSVILEDFIFEHENDSRFALECAFAKRLDDFLLDDDKLVYYDA